jgi:cell division protein FtsL
VHRRGGRRVAPALALAAVMVVATVFAVLLAQVVLAQSGFKMAQMRAELSKAEERHARLVLSAAKLGSAERIEHVAMQDLGMVHPERVEYIVADVRGTTTKPMARRGRESLLPLDDPAAALGGGSTP